MSLGITGSAARTSPGLVLSIAASDASQKSKRAADYVCTGISDCATIQDAIAQLPATGGKIQFSEGSFLLDQFNESYPNEQCRVIIDKPNVSISGMGDSTIIKTTINSYHIFVVVLPAAENFRLENLCMQGAGIASDNAITVKSPGSSLTNLLFKKWHKIGQTVNIVGNNSVLSNLRFEDAAGIQANGENCTILNVVGGNAALNNPFVAAKSNNSVIQNVVSMNQINTYPNARNTIISGCHAKFIEINGNTCIVTGNITQQGINDAGSNSHISNNYIAV